MAEEQEQTEESNEAETSRRKTRTGVVVSAKMDKTVTVAVTRKFMHTRYKKYVRDRDQYKAHDESNECKAGDKVLIEETRPTSKGKRWRIREILEEAPVV